MAQIVQISQFLTFHVEKQNTYLPCRPSDCNGQLFALIDFGCHCWNNLLMNYKHAEKRHVVLSSCQIDLSGLFLLLEAGLCFCSRMP